MFNRHLQTLTEPTQTCAAAYDYARIRRLVRLRAGFYRFTVAEKTVIGFGSPVDFLRSTPEADLAVCVFMVAMRRALSGAPVLQVTGLPTRVWPPPPRLVARVMAPFF